jgi:hypothetical protein
MVTDKQNIKLKKLYLKEYTNLDYVWITNDENRNRTF